jgi:glycosyltransferase involved in cell wall biosynthesis
MGDFSVVVPVYNKEYSVERCILSIERQILRPKEVILVNDGSSDKSLEKIYEIIKDLDSIEYKVVDQMNFGVSISRNIGIDCCSNEYVCFLDADDYWYPNFLFAINELINDYPKAVMFSTGHSVQKGDGLPLKANSGVIKGFRGCHQDFFKACSSGSIVNSSKVCVKKSVIEIVGGFPEGVSCGEDLFTWIEIARKGDVAYTDEVLSCVCQAIDCSRESRIGSVPYPLIYYGEEFNKTGVDQSLRKYLIRIGLRHVLGSISEGQYKEALVRIFYFYRISLSYALLSTFALFIPPMILKKIRQQ